MAVTAKFIADFTSFSDAVKKADVELKSFETGASKVESALKRMADNFSGRKIIQEASLAEAAIQKIGGVSTLTQAELAKLQTTFQQATDKMKALGIEVPPHIAKVQKEVTDAIEPTSKWGSAISLVKSAFGLLMGLQVTQWILGAAKAAIQYADTLKNLNATTSVSLQGLQKLEALGATSGVSIETLAQSVFKLQTNLDNDAARSALESMGLHFAEIQRLNPEDQFFTIAKSVSAIDDPIARANAGVALFGKTWQTIAPAMKQNLQDVIDGTTRMTDKQIEALDAAGDKWDLFVLNQTRNIRAFLGEAVQASDRFAEVQRRRDALFNPGLPATPNAPNLLPSVAGREAIDPAFIESLKVAGRTMAEQREQTVRLAEAQRELKATSDRAADSQRNFEASVRSFRPWPRAAAGEVGTFTDRIDVMADRIVTGVRELDLMTFSMDRLGNVAQTAGGSLSTGIAALSGMKKTFQEFADPKSVIGDVFGSVPGAILGAIQGGGNKLQAAGSAIGMQIFGEGSKLNTTISKGISSLFGTGGMLGKIGATLGSAIPVIGSLIGPAIQGLTKLFGKSEETAKVSPLRDMFFKAAGGLEVLNPKVQQLTGSLTLVDNIFKAKTVDAYNAAIKELSDALAFQDQALQTLTETAQRYGFTLAELGPTLQRQELDKQAQQLFKDFQVLTAGGLDQLLILEKMADAVNEYVQNAVSMGIEVPNAMRPMLEAMVRNGQLLDASGMKVEDLEKSGISFAITMSEGFKSLIDEVKRLTDAIARGLGLAIQNIPDGEFTVRGRVDLPENFPNEFGGGDVLDSSAAFAAGSGTTVNVNVEGSVTSERNLVRTIADAMAGDFGLHEVLT